MYMYDIDDIFCYVQALTITIQSNVCCKSWVCLHIALVYAIIKTGKLLVLGI